MFQNSILIRTHKNKLKMKVSKISQLEKLWLEFVWLWLGSSRLSWQQSSKAEFTKRKWKWGFQQKGLQTRTTKLVEHWAENRNASRDIFLIRSRQTKFYCHSHHARLNQTKSLYIRPTVSYVLVQRTIHAHLGRLRVVISKKLNFMNFYNVNFASFAI